MYYKKRRFAPLMFLGTCILAIKDKPSVQNGSEDAYNAFFCNSESVAKLDLFS